MSEIVRIRERYDRRGRVPHGFYSYFQQGNLFIAQSRERATLALLSRHGIKSLTNTSILEVGCGSGKWLLDFIRWGADPRGIWGVDLIEDRIQEANALVPHARLIRADAARLPFGDGRFDLVLQATVFTSIFDPEMKRLAAREILRVLSDDGLVIWYDFRYNNPWNRDVRGIGRREIKELFPRCRFDFNLVTLAPPLARRLVPLSWPLCSVLDRVPPLRTHYLAAIRKAV